GGGFAPGPVEEAAAEMLAARAAALIGFAADLLPGTGVRREGKIAATAVLAASAPLDDGGHIGGKFIGKQGRLRLDIFQFAQAGVVAAPLDQRRLELHCAVAGQEGEVFSDQLFLQVDGIGGYHYPLV